MNHRFLIILPTLLYTNINAKVNAVNWMILQDYINARKTESTAIKAKTSIEGCNLNSFIKHLQHLDNKYSMQELVVAVKDCHCPNKRKFFNAITARQLSK